ncbi:hypothetical protein MHTCC0001_23600 [Flavobacteriaceae bacterium MHTCC 0001]
MLYSQDVFKVEKYNKVHYDVWNDFVDKTKNATFLFHRNFMEYHSDRFDDFSLMVFRNEELVAIFPANRVANIVYSHQGLTYGGIFVNIKVSGVELRPILEALCSFAILKGVTSFILKRIPSIYESFFDGVWDCLMKNYRVVELSTQKLLSIDYSNYKIHKTKLKHYRRALNKGLSIKKETTFAPFWNQVLIPRLKTKHNTKPVHTLKEIEYLHKLFSLNLKQYNVYLNNTILAGITIFDKGRVVKSQYGATTDLGEKYYAMDFLFVHLIEHYRDVGKIFFSMGTVTDDNELGYNPGLLRQKIEFGCQEYPFKYFQIHLGD